MDKHTSSYRKNVKNMLKINNIKYREYTQFCDTNNRITTFLIHLHNMKFRSIEINVYESHNCCRLFVYCINDMVENEMIKLNYIKCCGENLVCAEFRENLEELVKELLWLEFFGFENIKKAK